MKAVFKASREATLHYLVLFTLAAFLLALGIFLHWTLLIPGGVVLALALFTMYFFRDPNRPIPNEPNVVVSPADGTIVGIEDINSTPHYEGPCKRVSIFLSVFNVHINRSPFDGIVERITYKPGQFVNAMRTNASELNEANTVRMKTEQGGMTVRQISGLIARRIVCKVEEGESLARGERFGMIKFGSRTELYLPTTAQICVTLKEKVKGGESIVARFP